MSSSTTIAKTENHSHAYTRFICGGVAGIASRTFTAPIDRVKVLRQTGHEPITGGLTALWRGNGINVLKNCPETAIRFGLHGFFKDVLYPPSKNGAAVDLLPVQRLLVASLSGFVSMSSVYPIEVVKTRMALRTSSESSSVLDCLRRIYSQGGLRSFYRGYLVAMTSYVPYSGMELALYELLKREYFERFRGVHYSCQPHMKPVSLPHLRMVESCTLVILSCSIPMFAIYPLNLLRTRFQASTALRSPSIPTAFRDIVQRDGFRGLYRGLTAQLTKTMPAVCISYFTFEALLELLQAPGLAAR